MQVYGGLVYMNFDQAIMERDGCGVYESLPMVCRNGAFRVDAIVNLVFLQDNLPKFWLSYLADPSDSGKAHNDVRKRWDSGDTEVREGMKGFANITDRGKAALAAGDFAALADLMDENFALRRKLYTDAALGVCYITTSNFFWSHTHCRTDFAEGQPTNGCDCSQAQGSR